MSTTAYVLIFVLSVGGYLFGYARGCRVHKKHMYSLITYSAGFHDAVFWRRRADEIERVMSADDLNIYEAGFSEGHKQSKENFMPR